MAATGEVVTYREVNDRSNQFAQLLGIAEWSQRAVNESDDFAEMNLGRLTAQLVAAFGSARALHHAGVLQFEQNQFQEFFRQRLFIGNVADADGPLVMMPCQHHHGLERVQTLLGDFHRQMASVNSI